MGTKSISKARPVSQEDPRGVRLSGAKLAEFLVRESCLDGPGPESSSHSFLRFGGRQVSVCATCRAGSSLVFEGSHSMLGPQRLHQKDSCAGCQGHSDEQDTHPLVGGLEQQGPRRAATRPEDVAGSQGRPQPSFLGIKVAPVFIDFF